MGDDVAVPDFVLSISFGCVRVCCLLSLSFDVLPCVFGCSCVWVFILVFLLYY